RWGPRQRHLGARHPDLHPGVPGTTGRPRLRARRGADHPRPARHPAHPASHPGGRAMRIARSELYAGRLLLIALMAITVLPFISIFTTALYPSGAVPVGLS